LTVSGIPALTTVGRYVIESELGAGGMGVVYAAFDPELDRRVAIKILHGDRASAERRRRLSREAQALARLSHPNVIAVYDVGLAGDDLFVAMELVDGQTVGEWIAASARPWREVQRVFVAAGSGLAAAHRKGMVHRDFKPDNVLLRADGHVLVSDFGLARISSEAETRDSGDDAAAPPVAASRDAMLTRPGALLGTPAYMAPEQHRGEPADARADQFAFCVALYEALYGERPFAAAGDSQLGATDALALDIVKGNLRPPPRDRDVPAWLRKLVLRGLAPAPGDRWPSMDALLHELRRDPARTRRRLALAGVAALAIAVAAYVAWPSGSSAGACDASSPIAAHWNAAALAQLVDNRDGHLEPEDYANYSSFATQWEAMHHAACIADASPDTHAVGVKQLACLDHTLRGFDTAVRVRPLDYAQQSRRPAIPVLDPCARAEPDAPVPDPLVFLRNLDDEFVAQPDERRFAYLHDDHLQIEDTDGRETTLASVPGATLAGWQGSTILLFDRATLLRVNADTGAVEAGARLPASTISVSPDGLHALTCDDAGELSVVSLGDGLRSPSLGAVELPKSRPYVRWSGTQVVVRDAYSASIQLADFATGHHSTLPHRIDYNSIGDPSVGWLDDHRVVFPGRVDREHGEGLWMTSVRDGQIEGPPRLLLEAPAGTGFSLAEIANRPTIVRQMVTENDLLRIHAGVASPILNAPSVSFIGAIDESGDRIDATDETGGGIITLADNRFTRETGSLAFQRDRTVVLEHAELDVIEAGSVRRAIMRNPALDGAVLRCALAVDRCFAVWPGKAVAEILGDRLGPRIPISHVFGIVVSPDGTRLAMTGRDAVRVIDVATQAVETWPSHTVCSRSNQALTWLRDGASLYVSELCDDGDTHVFHVQRDAQPVEIYASTGFISGLVVEPSGDLIAGVRRFTPSWLRYDGL
jgi:predicted Ser/Thr protein kinase